MLGVAPQTKWAICNYRALAILRLSDDSRSMQSEIADILDKTNVQVLAYSGDKDWILNWLQGEAWTAATKWKYQEKFNS